MVIADLALLCAPVVPPRLGVIAIILALAGAVWFTSWYLAHVRAAAKAAEA